jgi:hypothetical protein
LSREAEQTWKLCPSSSMIGQRAGTFPFMLALYSALAKVAG